MNNKLNKILLKKIKSFNDFVVNGDVFEKFLPSEFSMAYGNEKESNQVDSINNFKRDYIFVISFLDWGIGFSCDYTTKEALSHDGFIYYEYSKLTNEQIKNIINLYECYLHQLTFARRFKDTITKGIKLIYNKNKKVIHDFDFIYEEYGFCYFIKNNNELLFYIKKLKFLNNDNAPMYYSEIYSMLLELKDIISNNKNLNNLEINIKKIEDQYENYRTLILNN